MIEIAICLAIIGFALVAIIGVLPYGMNTQRDNRQETLIGQDASMLLETIRSGSHGADDLTNYVYAIANTGQSVGYLNPVLAGQMNFIGANSFPSITQWSSILTNGANIIGLLSTPEFFNNGASNHIIAYVRAMSGLAAEKPPQDNAIMVGDTFAYRLLCVNAPIAVDTNALQGYNLRLYDNQRELRLTFQWPLLPNNKADLNNVGYGRQTFRATIGGQLAADTNGFYFYQPQSFNQAP
jgi:type II secretory pathway pseudopilin PulG